MKENSEREIMQNSAFFTQFWMELQTRNGIFKNFTRAHYHDYIEILYCTCGKFDVWIDDNYNHIEKGDLVIINSEEVHRVDAVGKYENSIIVLRFDTNVIYSSAQSIFEVKYIHPFLTKSRATQKVFKCSEIAETCIPELMKKSWEEYKKKEYGYELAIRANICNVFLWVLRYWNRKGQKNEEIEIKNPELLPRFQEVMQYMYEHFSEEITAKQMARMCNLSYSYFSRCFKQISNQSFSDYLNYLRVSEAVKLLMTTELNITEVALAVGFSTSSYFIQQFKAIKGVSPKKFRKSITD